MTGSIFIYRLIKLPHHYIHHNNIVFLPENLNFESYLVDEQYEDAISAMLNSYHENDNYLVFKFIIYKVIVSEKLIQFNFYFMGFEQDLNQRLFFYYRLSDFHDLQYFNDEHLP